MAIKLVKGGRLELGLSEMNIGLGWNPNDGHGDDFDLDVSVFCLDQSGKCPSDKHFVFYGNKFSPDGAIEGADDDLTGCNSDEGDDELVRVQLDNVSTDIHEVVLVVSIYEALKRKQNFGQVYNSYIRILNAQTEEVLAIYELDEDFSTETSVVFGRLYRRNGEWKFEAIGKGYNEELDFFVKNYGLEIGQ